MGVVRKSSHVEMPCIKSDCLPQVANLPPAVKIVEVGPRDGLQNEKVCQRSDNICSYIVHNGK
jgi:hypothetical protein